MGRITCNDHQEMGHCQCCGKRMVFDKNDEDRLCTPCLHDFEDTQATAKRTIGKDKLLKLLDDE